MRHSRRSWDIEAAVDHCISIVSDIRHGSIRWVGNGHIAVEGAVKGGRTDQGTAGNAGTGEGKPFYNEFHGRISIQYAGQPYFVSEFGGIWWRANNAVSPDSWGYGERPKKIEEFYERFEGLCSALLDNPAMFGYCYTQLTDVYQEENGIFTFKRKVKFDMERIASIQKRRAAIEKR